MYLATTKPEPHIAVPWSPLLAKILSPTGSAPMLSLSGRSGFLFHPLPLRVLERRHGISVGGSSFPNGYCWKKKSKANKTTATRSLHHPHIHLPMRYLSALSGEISFYCLFTIVFLTPKTSAQPIINSHYIVLNESHSLNACWTLTPCLALGDREKKSVLALMEPAV